MEKETLIKRGSRTIGRIMEFRGRKVPVKFPERKLVTVEKKRDARTIPAPRNLTRRRYRTLKKTGVLT